MTKTFFVVIPFSPIISSAAENPLNQITGKKAESTGVKNHFEENRTQLEQRIGTVSQGLSRCGIRTVQLGTEEIVELFY